MKPYYADESVTLHHGKAEDVLHALPDASVSLIATDPPYFRVKDEEWDRQWDSPEAFIQWIGGLCVQWRRVLRPNGSLYVFASPEMDWDLEGEIRRHFNVLTNIRWRKPPFATKAEMIRKEDLREPFPASETILFAEQVQSETIDYLREECRIAGITPIELSGLLGFKATTGSIGPRRYLSLAGFAPISRPHWAELQRKTGRFSRSYDEVYRPFRLTGSTPYTDVWDFPTVGQYPGKHPCEKPVSMLEHIVSISSNPGDTVLDCFVGYGSTLQAAKRLGRRAVGIEADERCCQVTAERLRQGDLFREAVSA